MIVHYIQALAKSLSLPDKPLCISQNTEFILISCRPRHSRAEIIKGADGGKSRGQRPWFEPPVQGPATHENNWKLCQK